MENLVFSSTDIVYKQTLKDIKVLDYSPAVLSAIDNTFDTRFKAHVHAIYTNAPLFFKQEFMNTSNGFLLYQKYYFLLFLIDYANNHNISSEYKEWAASRKYESIEYLMKDPYPNERYNINYTDVYRKLIFPNDLQLSIIKDIKQSVMRTESYHEETLSSLAIDLTGNYLELKSDTHLVFDYSKFTDNFRAITMLGRLNYHDSYGRDARSETIETLFNKYDSITLESLTLSPYIYDHLENYYNVYVVFNSINCSSGIVSGANNVGGSVIFSGRFTLENGRLRFVPKIRTISYIKNSCTVKSLRFYITTDTDEVIPFNNIQRLSRSDIFNIPFIVAPEGDSVNIHSNNLELKYSLSENVIRAIPDVNSNCCNYVLKRKCNYAMCGGADKIVCRFDSENNYGDLSEFTMSQLFSTIAGYHMIGDKANIYELTLRKITPTYYIVKNIVDNDSAIYNYYKTYSNIVKVPIGLESYAKGVLFSHGERRKIDGGIEFVKYLISISDACVVYKEDRDCYRVVSTKELPNDTRDLHLRIYCYDKRPINNIYNTNESTDINYCKLHMQGTQDYLYVKINEKFMLDPSGDVYMLSEDGCVYSISNPKTYALYISNDNEIYEVESYEYSNIGGDFPTFNVGETVIMLNLTNEHSFDDNVRYEIYKNDSPYVQFKTKSDSHNEIYTYNLHDISESYSCKIINGVAVSNKHSTIPFEKALQQKYLTVSSSADAMVVLRLN